MTEASIIPRKRTLKPVIIAMIAFLALGLSAGAAMLWWQKRNIEPIVLNEQEKVIVEKKIKPAEYQPGEKTIILTERELNGLLHMHTQLGDKVKLELAKDAIHARVRTQLDPDVPILGGKTLKAKARFLVSTEQKDPEIILDDLTLYGISLPNAWLGELKGKNLLETLAGDPEKTAFGRGIEEISIESGEIRIQLAE